MICGVGSILGCVSKMLFMLVIGLVLNMLMVVKIWLWLILVFRVFFVISLECEVFMRSDCVFIVVRFLVVIMFCVFGFRWICRLMMLDEVKKFLWLLVIVVLFFVVWVWFVFEFYYCMFSLIVLVYFVIVLVICLYL